MSRDGQRSGIVFSASGDKRSSGASPSDSPKMSMMAAALHNEYSDLEDDEDEEIPPVASFQGFSQNRSNFGDFDKSSTTKMEQSGKQNAMVSQYGIGAKLLMGMGYQAGKGLGSKQHGIAVPIETKLRPQGLGIGGIREKSVEKSVESSDDEDQKGHGVVSFSKPTYDLFAAIDALERAGIAVPVHYKELSDNASTSQNALELERAHTKLSKISSDVAVIDSKLRNIHLEIEHLDVSLEKEKLESTTLQLLVSKLEASVDSPSSANLLEELTKEPFSKLADIQTIFVAYAQPYVEQLFTSIDEEALGRLSNLAVLYRGLETGLEATIVNPWDSLILCLLKKNFETSATSENHRNSIYDVRFWLDSPVVINSPLVEQLCLVEIVVPNLANTIDRWDLVEGFDSSIIECLSDYDWDDASRRSIMELVADRYEGHFSQCWREMAMQSEFWSAYNAKMRPVLDHFCSTGILLIASYHEKRANSLKRHVILELVRFCQTHPGVASIEKSLALIMEFQSFEIITHQQSEVIMSFAILNPMVRTLEETLRQGNSVSSLFHSWQVQFTSLARHYPDIRSLLLWYTNVFINSMRYFREGKDAGTSLPAYNQEEFPGSDLEKMVLGEVDGSSSAYATAAQDLLVTFKDVVQQACLQSNVVLQATGLRDASMNEIFELKFPSGVVRECYMSNDVLWVRGSAGFAPVDLLEFLKGRGERI